MSFAVKPIEKLYMFAFLWMRRNLQIDKNPRILASNYLEVPQIIETKYPASVIVFSGVESDENVIPPHFIKVGLKISTTEYINILQK